MLDYLLLLLSLIHATVRNRDAFAAENLLLRHQLAVLTRPTRKRPRLRARDKLVWVIARLVRRDWRKHVLVVRPETVVRWHRQGWQLFWRWRSRAQIGRPRLSAKVRELIAAMAWGRTPRYLIRDRDAVYGGDFVPRARRLGISTVLTPVRAPRANAIAERLVGTLRRECLDHLVIVNEAHLRAVLSEFAC